MSEHPDVLIVGGGVIGLTVAYYLAREGVSVAVVDRADFGQEASWAGAGIIPPGNPARAGTPFDLLRAHSSCLYPTLSQELRDRTGVDNGYLRCGGLELPDGLDDAPQEWRSEGIHFQTVAAQDLPTLEPNLAPGLGPAYYLPDMAQVRNPRHLKALVAANTALGVRRHPGCSAHDFDRQGSRILAVLTSSGPLAASRFVLAPGAWSDALLDKVHWTLAIRPVRGQIALLNSGAPLFHRVLLQGKRYLVPRPDGRVLIGSTEEDAGFDKRTTAGAIGDLLTFGTSLVPSLARASLERCWAGLRPGTEDEMPYLGAVPSFDNLYVAAGHFRAGIQLSPATGLVMKELLLGQPLTLPLEAFRLDRPPAPPRPSAFRS